MFDDQIAISQFPSLTISGPAPEYADRIMWLRDARFHIGHFVFRMPDEVHWSPEVFEICGLPVKHGPLGLEDVFSVFDSDDRARLAELLAQALRGKTGYQATLRLRRPDGEVRLVETVGDVVLEDGHLTAVVGLMRDVTDVPRPTAPMGETDRIKTVIEAMPVPAVLTDRQMRIVACSDTWCKSHGVSRADAIGKDLVQAVEKAPVGWALEHEKVVAGKAASTERQFVNPTTGRPVRCQTTLTPWVGEDGMVQGVITVVGWSEFAFASKEVAALVRRKNGR